MAGYKPKAPFNVAAFILKPIKTIKKGVTVKEFVPNEKPIFCSFKTFGGTEKIINDVLAVEDTGVIETWFNPDITSDCNIRIGTKDYEILGTPENIEMRNQYMVFKVKAVKGGA